MRLSRRVDVGGVAVGGGAPVSIQSMCNTDTRDVDATVAQILRLQGAGCEIVRVSVYDGDCVTAIRKICDRISIPLVADVHFDHQLAIGAVENGADKLRINPGNIGGQDKIAVLADCCRSHGVPIRIGVNAGSLQKELVDRFGVTAQAMLHSALENVSLLERQHFYDTVISMKASNVPMMVAGYRLLADRTDYPLHLGVTEAGTERDALVKSAAGIGALLLDGIGDTVRVSITGDPVKEIAAAREILCATGVRRGLELISCPTCGRCSMDIEAIANEVRRRLPESGAVLRIAVMGCAVNGPGEAREADVGLACTRTGGVLFKKGKPLRKVSREALVDELMKEIYSMLEEA
ncbi:MAG: flavodoxin-dependent (E)-4-hydroxy-3-methylbut-2-enyl-diphosphate synthase [Christensenellales bacterium]|jgi:(E)-4-hydroxy-3-methylbut-2-enyl-diphosphate synthase